MTGPDYVGYLKTDAESWKNAHLTFSNCRAWPGFLFKFFFQEILSAKAIAMPLLNFFYSFLTFLNFLI
jgi:hypothetical protein